MIHGAAYEIVDIGMRMLSPRELFAAQASRTITTSSRHFMANRSQTQQIALAGNSVPPPMAEHLARTNLTDG